MTVRVLIEYLGVNERLPELHSCPLKERKDSLTMRASCSIHYLFLTGFLFLLKTKDRNAPPPTPRAAPVGLAVCERQTDARAVWM